MLPLGLRPRRPRAFCPGNADAEWRLVVTAYRLRSAVGPFTAAAAAATAATAIGTIAAIAATAAAIAVSACATSTALAADTSEDASAGLDVCSCSRFPVVMPAVSRSIERGVGLAVVPADRDHSELAGGGLVEHGELLGAEPPREQSGADGEHVACDAAATSASAASHEAPHSLQRQPQVGQRATCCKRPTAGRRRETGDIWIRHALAHCLTPPDCSHCQPRQQERRHPRCLCGGCIMQRGPGRGRKQRESAAGAQGLVRRGPRGSRDDSRRLAERPLRRRPPLRLRLRLRRRLLCQGNRAALLSEPRSGHGGVPPSNEPGAGTAPSGVSLSCSIR